MIVGSLAIITVAVYYIKQPVLDLGPITIHHAQRTVASLSLSIEPSWRANGDWIAYEDGAAAKVVGKNLKWVKIYRWPADTGRGEIPDDIFVGNASRLSTQDDTWLFPIPSNLTSESFWAEAETSDGLIISSRSPLGLGFPIIYYSKSETASWNSYQNKKYGFEFKYPQDWPLVEQNPDFLDFGIATYNRGSKISLDLNCSSIFNSSGPTQYIEENNPIEIYGNNFIEKNLLVMDQGQKKLVKQWVTFSTNTTGSQICGEIRFINHTFEDEGQLMQILSTFKFTK